MDINTVKVIYTVTLSQEEMLSIIFGAADYMKEEWPELWEKVTDDYSELVFEVVAHPEYT